ncbi:MAG: ClbS/DfsB family four-helix bundle protein, partial [Ktedonobacterales bacterium]
HNAALANMAQPDHPITVLPTAAITFTAPTATGDTGVGSVPPPRSIGAFPAPTTKDELLATMAAGRAQWEALLTEAQARGTERMQEPGVESAWSIKDAVIHVAYYERRVGNMLRAALASAVYTHTTLDQLALDERNERIYQEGKARPLTEALEAEQIAWERLHTAVERIPEANLFDAKRAGEWVAWEEDTLEPLWQSVASETYQHYAEHLPAIRAWLAK